MIALIRIGIREGAHNHGQEREHGTKVIVRLVDNLCLIQVNFYQAISVLVVAEIHMPTDYVNVLHKTNPAISVVDYITLNLYVA